MCADILIPLKGNWDGWVCSSHYLTDKDGNNYLPQDITDTHYGRILCREKVGYQHTISTLKYRLEALTEEYEQKLREIDEYHQFITLAKNVFSKENKA